MRRDGRGAASSLTLLLLGGGAQSLLRVVFAGLTARLVSPAQTGVFTLALSIVILLSAVADPALTEATVRRGSQARRSRSTFFWVNLCLAAAMALAIAVGSGPIADGFGQPGARSLLRALSILPVITALALGPFVELRRAHRFRDIALVESLACLVGCVIGGTVAVRGGGAWSLFGYQLGWTTGRLAGGLALSPWRAGLAFDLRALRQALRFSASVWSSRVALTLAGQLDKLIVGALLGAAVLGLYSRAALFMSLPLQLIATAATTALVPSLARHRLAPDRLRHEFLATSSLIATLTFPAFVGASAVAAPLVGAVLGHGKTWEWSGVATLLTVMAPAAALDSLTHPQRSLLVAQGRPGVALLLTLTGAGLLLGALAVGARWGLPGVAWGYVAATSTTFALFTALTLRRLKLPILRFGQSIGRVALATLAMTLAILAARRGLAAAGIGDAFQLAALVALGAAVYAACLGRGRLAGLADLLRTGSAPEVAPEAASPSP
ncbi:MAG TPA: oligosaccharide flippase family protein [Phenylobacterium sp.]